MSASIRWGVPSPGTFADGAGSAIGDATCSAGGSTITGGAGSATGDANCSGIGASFADGAGSATGDANATGRADSNVLAAGAPRSLLGFWMGGAEAPQAGTFQDGAGTATGDATTSATGSALVDGAGSATGDATCSGAGTTAAVNADGAGSATGDATCDGFIEDATPAVVTPPVVADAGGVGQVFIPAWGRGKPVKKPKKKKRLDDLDEMIAELRSRIQDVPVEANAEDIYQRAVRVSQALANRPGVSLGEIDNQIAVLEAVLQEIDDEEVIMLLAA